MNDLRASIFYWTSSGIVTNDRNFSNIGDDVDNGVVSSDADDCNNNGAFISNNIGGNADSDGGSDGLEGGRGR